MKAIRALNVAKRPIKSVYPKPFVVQIEGREKRALGDHFGLSNFGVNLTRLKPNAKSALRHAHSKQDEFMYILEGKPTLITNEGKSILSPGMCIGFPAGGKNANHLVNESLKEVLYLEIGDRTPGDEAHYPDDDLQAQHVDGEWLFLHKNGNPY